MIPPEVRGELDQTPAWWDRQYRALVDAAFEAVPFNPDEHDGHNIITISSYAGPVRVMCAECPTRLVPKGPAHDRPVA